MTDMKLQLGDSRISSNQVLSHGLFYLPRNRKVPATHMWTKNRMKIMLKKKPRKKWQVYLSGSTFFLYWEMLLSLVKSFSTMMQFDSNSC